jgi:hypothetical protein
MKHNKRKPNLKRTLKYSSLLTAIIFSVLYLAMLLVQVALGVQMNTVENIAICLVASFAIMLLLVCIRKYHCFYISVGYIDNNGVVNHRWSRCWTGTGAISEVVAQVGSENISEIIGAIKLSEKDYREMWDRANAKVENSFQ